MPIKYCKGSRIAFSFEPREHGFDKFLGKGKGGNCLLVVGHHWNLL